MISPSVLTVIVNYKTADMSLRSAEFALRAMEGIRGGIIIVDNDSGDGSFEEMTAHAKEQSWSEEGKVRVLQSGCNGGYGWGNNFGIRAGLSDGSQPDYIYILNSDAFPAPDAIRILLDHLDQNPQTGFAGSYVLGADSNSAFGADSNSAFRFPSVLSEFETSICFGPVSRLLKNYIVAGYSSKEICDVDWLCGASLMMRRDMLDQIGLFDETFFLYFEETDLCLRGRRAGYKAQYVPKSFVKHIGSVSTGMHSWRQVPAYWFDSRLYYFTKNHGTFYATGATLAHLSGGFLHWVRCLITRKKRDAPPFFLTNLAWHDLKAGLRACIPKARRAGHTKSSHGE